MGDSCQHRADATCHSHPRFRYSEDDVVSYVLQLLQGLEYLHSRRIVHLDIKPDNIVISGMNSLKIIDFGSAQTYNPLVLRQLGRRVGTLEYMCEWGTGCGTWGEGWGRYEHAGAQVCLCTGGLGNGEKLSYPWGSRSLLRCWGCLLRVSEGCWAQWESLCAGGQLGDPCRCWDLSGY